MRKSIIAALAASVIAVPAYAADIVLPPAAPIAPPPPAAATSTVAGYVGVYGGVLTNFSAAVAAVAADAAIAMSRQRMDIQIELRDLTIFSSGTTISLAAALVHAYRRNSNAAVGAFGGYEAVFGGGGIGTNVFHLGAEAAMFRAQTTLYAQLAAVVATGGGTTTWGAYVRGVVRFFPRDNVRFEGGVRYLYLASGGAQVITPEIEAEFQLPGRPLSFVGTFRGTFAVGGGAALYTALAGIRFNIGGGDLIDQGAPMDTLPLIY
jgi:hypothetical protein